MAGPFLGIPLLLGTLTLSVDLIYYDPQPGQNRLSDRPIPVAVTDSESTRQTPSHLKAAVSKTSVVSATSTGPEVDDLLDVTLAGDAALPNSRAFAPPRPPYGGGSQR